MRADGGLVFSDRRTGGGAILHTGDPAVKSTPGPAGTVELPSLPPGNTRRHVRVSGRGYRVAWHEPARERRGRDPRRSRFCWRRSPRASLMRSRSSSRPWRCPRLAPPPPHRGHDRRRERGRGEAENGARLGSAASSVRNPDADRVQSVFAARLINLVVQSRECLVGEARPLAGGARLAYAGDPSPTPVTFGFKRAGRSGVGEWLANAACPRPGFSGACIGRLDFHEPLE